MTNKSGDIGTKTAGWVADYLRDNGFPSVERRVQYGARDQGDLTGTPGICWEVKGGHAAENASDLDVVRWLAETETERINARADIGVLVMKRKAIGAANAGRWWAVMPSGTLASLYLNAFDGEGYPVRLHLADAVTLLRAAGYGTPLTTEAECPYCTHALASHDQPDCFECTNSGAVCASEDVA